MRFSVLCLLAASFVLTGCGKPEEDEQVEIDRMVKLEEEEKVAEWTAPQESSLLSGEPHAQEVIADELSDSETPR